MSDVVRAQSEASSPFSIPTAVQMTGGWYARIKTKATLRFAFCITLSFLFLMYSDVGVDHSNDDSTSSASLRSSNDAASSNHQLSVMKNKHRQVQADIPNYYYSEVSTNVLGDLNYSVVVANPLKGLVVNPYKIKSIDYRIPHSLEAYYVPFDTVMVGNNEFNWEPFELKLNETASRNSHAIPRFYVHYPGEPLRIPEYLAGQIDVGSYTEKGGGLSPYYNDTDLLQAFDQFIVEFGRKYDGDPRIAFIQMGLLGFWGEFHDSGNGFLPDYVKEQVVQWYIKAFSKTKIQTRYPRASAYANNVGYHDDSFGYATLDGAANGGVDRWHFFWPLVVASNQTDFWKRSVMGGEIRPEIMEEIFSEKYPTATEYHQDFMLCVNTTHATYMKHTWFFRTEAELNNSEVDTALLATAHMGYNFVLQKVSVLQSNENPGKVHIDVILEQFGVAPFYYPLGIKLTCADESRRITGIENDLINEHDSQTYRFENVPATYSCLNNVSFALISPMTYPTNPIRFAQGATGFVNMNIPMPPTSSSQPTPQKATLSPASLSPSSPSPQTAAPTIIAPTIVPVTLGPSGVPTTIPKLAPTRAPSFDPTRTPSFAPTRAPSLAPTRAPSLAPTRAPSLAPTRAPSLAPTRAPSPAPTRVPSLAPTLAPSRVPTIAPSLAPVTVEPTSSPTEVPKNVPARTPTLAPFTGEPSSEPTSIPKSDPTPAPFTDEPSSKPTSIPTRTPTDAPRHAPTRAPIVEPSSAPTSIPTRTPIRRAPITRAPVTRAPFTATPSSAPMSIPTRAPSHGPTHSPITTPITLEPSSAPTPIPTGSPTHSTTHFSTSADITAEPSSAPTPIPTRVPTHPPTRPPITAEPTNLPTSIPTSAPTQVPTQIPTSDPYNLESSDEPTSIPTLASFTLEPSSATTSTSTHYSSDTETSFPVNTPTPANASNVPMPTYVPPVIPSRDTIEFLLVNAESNFVLRPIVDGDTVNFSEEGTKDLSLKCSISLDPEDVFNDEEKLYVEFRWTEKKNRYNKEIKIEATAPYAMGGGYFPDYAPVTYLSYIGRKYVKAILKKRVGRKPDEDKDEIIAAKTIAFTIIDQDVEDLTSEKSRVIQNYFNLLR